MSGGEKIKLLVFTLHFWLQRLHEINNKCNKTNKKYNNKQQKIKQNLKAESKTNRRSKMKIERE